MAFSTNLRSLRKEMGITQNILGKNVGISRQAIAAYESGKREPDYRILFKIVDFFGVSIDFILGRTNQRPVGSYNVAKNIEHIKGDLSYMEFSKDIGDKTGVMVLPEMLELYVKGKTLPDKSALTLLSKYANVKEEYFYLDNLKQNKVIIENKNRSGGTDVLNIESMVGSNSNNGKLKTWIEDENNIKYIELSKELKDSGITVDMFRPLVENFKKSKNDLS